jgi:hypothetical protein
MGDFRIVIDAVGGHGQDRENKSGSGINFGDPADDYPTPEALALKFVEELKAKGNSVQGAKVIHWPLEALGHDGQYTDQLKNGRSSQIVDDLLTGKRVGNF